MQNREPNMIESLITKLTLEEKVSLVHGATNFENGRVERLGIPPLVMSDGPNGVREELGDARRDDDACTALPTGIAIAATWDPELAHAYGEVLGAETRARGKDIILGPAINIHRTPLCGRNFEYMGEDPLLVSDIVTPFIRGIQSQGVAACVKHFALNNQELERRTVNVEVDERALREIYLPAFEAAVKNGKSLTVMAAYNQFRGNPCCGNALLLCDILKNEWGFEGAVISDWGGASDTEGSATGGLDIEMGGGPETHLMGAPYLEALREGRLDEADLDDKVRRILTVLQALGNLSACGTGQWPVLRLVPHAEGQE